MIETTVEERKRIYERAIEFIKAIDDNDDWGYPTSLCIVLANILFTGNPRNQNGYANAPWGTWGYEFKLHFPEFRLVDYPGIGSWDDNKRIRILQTGIEECNKTREVQ